MTKSWQASAPSNIALIKYMGKTDHTVNTPTNASISYTLDHLRSFVELSLTDKKDQWLPQDSDTDEFPVRLTDKGAQRFENHLGFLKTQLGLTDYNFEIRSSNNFPPDCGLASSASSFAALTLCAYEAAKELANKDMNLQKLSSLSREGSGSSCRSFYTPWAKWEKDYAEEEHLACGNLLHQAVVVSGEKKEVSSSAAHKLVATSELFKGRTERAESRLSSLLTSLNENTDAAWKKSYDICWAEFWDMHALFETAETPFGYMNGKSLEVLNIVRNYWNENNAGPIVTMDAGPNVHLLYRRQDETHYNNIQSLLKDFNVIGSVDA